MRVCVVGESGKLVEYMVQHALDRGHEVVGVCREQSVGKLAEFEGQITVVPGATERPRGQEQAVAGATACSSWSSRARSTGTRRETAQAVLDHAEPGAPVF